MKPKDSRDTGVQPNGDARHPEETCTSPLLHARVRLHWVWPLMAKNFISFLSTGITFNEKVLNYIINYKRYKKKTAKWLIKLPRGWNHACITQKRTL